MSPRRFTRGPVGLVRRALAPAALEMQGELPALRDRLHALEQENAGLRERLDAQARELGGRVEELDRRTAELDRRAEELGRRADELGGGLHEARRLNLRIAELTDLVTELVLPLHQREIDPAVLARLDPDTL
ncbi:DUF6752 domain-containing protein [Blastococcus sp. TF02A_35]|uniref:DUF6752 domain-containing protein n=1 Tax=Blastococcus sp. TF02A-35 TaxID=2559612 RepID=UPI0010748C9F|nr:DUF6752 domain-containing protein [Blastococcus sp. TF02A_35]TFV53590.1 hypothetical protein E4P43_01505 [Blastococcus sp. TF02A_35]